MKLELDINKKEIQLICEKEQKIKNINIDKFFEYIDKYSDINCCDFCKNKKKYNFSHNYYLCKTCNNNILCQKCYMQHDKKEDIIRFKIDSTCKKHYTSYESYCPICNENKCPYCSFEHNNEHEKYEILLKKKLLSKNKLDEFKSNIITTEKNKNDIEKKIELILKELLKKYYL